MAKNGHVGMALLDDRHATGCDGQEYSTCRAVPYGDGIMVVFCEWCGDCGAADYDIVGSIDPPEGRR
jgi:hypothetical protein